MKMTVLVGCLSLMVSLSAGGIAFYDLGTLPGGTHSSDYAISDVGNVVVGVVSMGPDSQAFRWTMEGGISGLGYLSGYNSSTAYEVSGDGSVVVGFVRSAAGQGQAFRWTEGDGMAGLGYLNGGSAYSSAAAVSADGGVVTGTAGTTSGMRAFRWTQAGGMENLGALPGNNESTGNGISADGSTIVGLSYSLTPLLSTDWQAVRWTQADGLVGLGWLPGHDRSQAISASTDGSVIVGMSGSSTEQTGFRWDQESGMQDLGLREALGVSGDGSIVVGSISDGAAVWDAINGVRELRQLIINSGIELNNWILASAQDISADGRVITGVGQYDGQLRAWAVVIPEPASAILLVTGLAFLVGCRLFRAAA